MDGATKRRLAEHVRRAFTSELKKHGLSRTKSTFWCRETPETIQFIHLHLFTYKPGFRLHPGIRLLNSTFEGLALNGLDVTDVPGYDFNYTEDEIDRTRCALDLARYVTAEVLPWFEAYSTAPMLRSEDSPLAADEKVLVGRPVNGKSAAVSRKLLGVV